MDTTAKFKDWASRESCLWNGVEDEVMFRIGDLCWVDNFPVEVLMLVICVLDILLINFACSL